LSWDGKTPNEIAAELDCHPQTVRIHLKRFTLRGIAGLGMRPGSGRKSRLLKRPPSKSNAVRSGAFICMKACAGVTPTVGARVMIRTSSQKNTGRLPLH
jgi:hypothetical protein